MEMIDGRKNFKPKTVNQNVIDLFDEFPEYYWDEKDLFIYKLAKRHYTYKALVIAGYILWPLAIFWLPALGGKFIDFITWASHGFIDAYKETSGNMLFYIMGFSLTSPITLPIFIFNGFALNPLVLKIIMFNRKYPYIEEIMDVLKFSKGDRSKISAGAFAGTIVSRFIK